MDGGAVVESVEDLENARPIDGGVAPDPPQERQVEPFGAAFGQVGARAAAVAHEAAQDPPQACRSRDVEEDHGVGSREARILIAALVRKEVAVEDPPIALDRRGELAASD